MGAAYRVEATPAARRDLRRLSPDVRRRIAARIDALADDPRPTGARALAGPDRFLRLRVGEYRIVYDVDDASQTITIKLVMHRRDVYRRLPDR